MALASIVGQFGQLQRGHAGVEVQVLAAGNGATALQVGKGEGAWWAQQHLFHWPSQRAVWLRSKRWAAETL